MKQDEWVLRWHDDFDGDCVDTEKWEFELGNGFRDPDSGAWVGGWGNEELQYYTSNPENAFVRDSVLHLRALRQAVHGCAYTSARLRSRRADGSALFAQRYGRFEFRACVPHGKGLWPALWMLPLEDHYGRWAASGEIDVLEICGDASREVLGSTHFGATFPHRELVTHRLPLVGGTSISDWHCYAVEWEPGVLRWEFDGTTWARQDFWWSSSKTQDGRGSVPTCEGEINPWPAPFDQPFYLLMNVAVGGNFAGNPDSSTQFPAELLVDYVRVYERRSGYAPATPRGVGTMPWDGTSAAGGVAQR